MNNPLVSVIIPTYNRAALISDTIMSVLRQSYRNIEVIVVSDGGTDNTESVIEQIRDKRLQFTRIPENTGLPAVVRNTGIKSAKGAFIAFCDDDDMWLERKIEAQMKELDKNAFLLGIVTNTFLYPGRKLNGFFLLKDKYIDYHSLLLDIGNPINTSTVLLRKEVFDVIGLFDESKMLKVNEDIDLWLRILRFRNRSIKLLRKPWINHRVNSSFKLTLSEDFEIMNTIKTYKYIYQKHLPLSESWLNTISDSHQYHKCMYVSKISMKLHFGILSAKDVIKEKKIPVTKKVGIMIKFFLKRIYYYFSLFSFEKETLRQ